MPKHGQWCLHLAPSSANGKSFLNEGAMAHAGLVIFNDSMWVATGNGGYGPKNDQYGNCVLKLSLPDMVVSHIL